MKSDTSAFVLDLTFEALSKMVSACGEAPFRAGQIWQGIYRDLRPGWEAFTTLSRPLRERFAAALEYSHLTPVQDLVSSDKETQKTLFTLPDGHAIEAVLMRYTSRQTLCISSQAGCAMGCSFCATGQMGYRRNLSSGEIIEQVLHYARLLRSEGKSVTNIVVMGMGEPFLNYDAVLTAVDRLNDPSGFNLGERRFTISTVGIIPGIERFTREKRQVNLAVSLHAANDDLRSQLIPANQKYPIRDILLACRSYIDQTHRRVTFEWALIQGINDRPQDARELAFLLRGMLCHVNLIALNPTRRFKGTPTAGQQVEAFKAILEQHNIPCSIRLRRGIDIQAGCGQLAERLPARQR